MSDKNFNKTILISGGGTGGHIYSAIAIAQEFYRRYPGRKIYYIGKSDGREKTIVAQTNIPIRFYGISAEGFPRRITPAIFKAIYRTMLGLMEARKIIKQTQPDLVIGTGGYVSVAAVLNAQWLGIPTLIHEQNVVSGIANRLLSKKARLIAISYPESINYFPADKIRLTGNPIRTELIELNREKSMMEFGFNLDNPILFIFGGSQGSVAINRVVIDALDILNKKSIRLQGIFQTGEKHYQEIQEKIDKLKNLHFIVQPYLHNIQDAYAVADLVICRAGAISLSEITFCGLPAILIPYPHATGNHQEKNARALERNQAALVILENELTPDILAQQIHILITDSALRNKMSQQSKSMALPDATIHICNLIDKILN